MRHVYKAKAGCFGARTMATITQLFYDGNFSNPLRWSHKTSHDNISAFPVATNTFCDMEGPFRLCAVERGKVVGWGSGLVPVGVW